LFRRLCYPNRLADLQKIFGRSKPELSYMFNAMINHVYYGHRHLVTSLNQWWLSPNNLLKYSTCIANKGGCLKKCFGFIDGTSFYCRLYQVFVIINGAVITNKFNFTLGTIHRTCRPGRHQKECYSGHKRVHCLKYQSVVIPNGLLANIHGPVSGRRHDSFMLYDSKILENLQTKLRQDNAPEDFYLYGDSGYPLKRLLITPFQGQNLSEQETDFNKNMSAMRVSVEWEFGRLFKEFAFLDLKKIKKYFYSP